ITPQTDYGSPSLFTGLSQKNSPVAVRTGVFSDGDSIGVEVMFRSDSALTPNGLLFIGLFEDTVFRTNANGEKDPRHVFRAGTNTLLNVVLPQTIGDSTTLLYRFKKKPEWFAARLFAATVLYDQQNNYIQSAASRDEGENPLRLFMKPRETDIRIFPNPI